MVNFVKFVPVILFSITELFQCSGKVTLTGEGTEESPYLISSAEEFAAIEDTYDAQTFKYYKLVSDIEITNSKHTINRIYGCLDGDNHTIVIKTLKYRNEKYQASPYGQTSFGLIRGASNPTIKNITFDMDVTTTPDDIGYIKDKPIFRGGVFGKISNGTFENVTTKGTFSYKDNGYTTAYVGGLCGELDISRDGVAFKNCNFGMNVSCHTYGNVAGGIAGFMDHKLGTIQNYTVDLVGCLGTGNISTKATITGISCSIGGGFFGGINCDSLSTAVNNVGSVFSGNITALRKGSIYGGKYGGI